MSKARRESITKLRRLTEELNDRDRQLKVNSKALWIMQEGIASLRDLVADEASSRETIMSRLDELMLMIDTHGCKRCQ